MDRRSMSAPRGILLFVIGSLMMPCVVRGQMYPFTTLSTADGLTQSAVSCIFQDSRGRLWFGT